MDNRRLILTGALLALMFFTFMQWRDFQAEHIANNTIETTLDNNGVAINPEEQAPILEGETPQLITSAATDEASVAQIGDQVTIETDLIKATLTTVGGHIDSLVLKKYPVDVDHKDTPFQLISNNSSNYLIEGSGLTSNKRNLVPDHNALYSVNVVEGSADATKQVVFTHSGENGITTKKTYVFSEDSYRIHVNYSIQNESSQPIVVSHYAFLQRNNQPPVGSGSQFGARSFYGGAIYSDDTKYSKLDFDELADNEAAQNTSDGWIAMLQHYFVTGWLPGKNVPLQLSSKQLGNGIYRLQYLSNDSVTIANSESANIETDLYVGPKVKKNLDTLPGTDFDLTIDFGWLTIIANPLLFLLKFIYNFVGNWGWAIIGVTIIIKGIFFPLSAAAYKSSAKMRRLGPRLQTLRERYGDDRQGFQQEMMKLYKEEKINPAGGCLPILVQIPVFIALYWVLLESVELRQASFLWLKDLSIPDPIFVLPVLYFISMWAMQKLNPAPLDPMQQKIMAALPVVFSVMMIWFPSGLVLYWVVNNILSLAQQWYITRRYS